MRLEHAFLAKMREELSSRYEFHEHVKMFRILANAVHIDLNQMRAYDKWMINNAEDTILIIDVVNLLGIYKLFFLHDLCT